MTLIRKATEKNKNGRLGFNNIPTYLHKYEEHAYELLQLLLLTKLNKFNQ